MLTYDEMIKKWDNGNRSEVIDAIRAMDSVDAALTAVCLVSRMTQNDVAILKSTLFHDNGPKTA